MKSNAVTPAQMRAVVEQLLGAWLRAPSLRLGQMIDSALMREATGPDLFNCEDLELVRRIEALLEEVGL